MRDDAYYNHEELKNVDIFLYDYYSYLSFENNVLCKLFFLNVKEILNYFISEFKNKLKTSSKNNNFEKNFFVNKTFPVTIF